MKRLILFDVDGTLTHSNEMDTDCFVQAMSEYLQTPVDSDWSRYGNVTDSGIAAELLERHRCPPGDSEWVRTRFLSLIEQALRMSPECCTEVPGASNLLQRIRDMSDFKAGLATGGWGASARAKLRHAGIDISGFAFASADDAQSRVEIMKICLSRMGGGEGDAVVYVGDGLWDLAACRSLGWRFIGIATGAAADRLRSAGAAAIFENFNHPAMYREMVRND